MTRDEFMKITKVDKDRLYSLERHGRLPFDRATGGKKHERGNYTPLAALLFLLFDDATTGADGLGINTTQASAWLRIATPMIEQKLEKIMLTGQRMHSGDQTVDEWLLLVAFSTGGRLIHCAPTSELFSLISSSKEPIVRFFGLNLSRAATILLIRADRAKVALGDFWED